MKNVFDNILEENPRLQMSEKQSIPINDKKSSFMYSTVHHQQFYQFPFSLFLQPPPPPVVSSFPPPRPVVSSPPQPLFLQMDIQTKSKKIALLFFQPRKKLWLFCENITIFANGSLMGGSLITNLEKLISIASVLQSRLTSFSPLPQPLSPHPHPL